MITYRICNPLYQDDLSGTGAKLYGSRWNSVGTPVLYLASSISLASLEMMVHLQFADASRDFALLYINAPDTASVHTLEPAKLKTGWQQDIGYSRFIGDQFIQSAQNLLLKVPSAIVEEEYNYLANPLHADFGKIKINRSRTFHFDERLFNLR